MFWYSIRKVGFKSLRSELCNYAFCIVQLLALLLVWGEIASCHHAHSKEHKRKGEVLTAVTKSSAIMCHQISDTVQSVAVSKA